MKLFEDLGKVKSDEELADLKKRFPSYDMGYLCQAAGVFRQEEREWMENLWQQYEPYADSHFIDDFKKQFSQRSWELYLGTTLLNRGFKLGPHKDVGPDFDMRDEQNQRLAWVEAIAAEPGSGRDRVPDMINGVLTNIPEEEMLLRITNALDQKFKKYQTEIINGIVKEGEPYIIAINRSKVGHVDAEIPLILKATYGIGHQTLRIPIGDESKDAPESFWSSRLNINKKSGSEVSMLFFEDPAHSGISAAIYCMDNIISSPRLPEEMGENFFLIHNYLAKPLPDGFFPFGEEYKVEGNFIKKIRERKNWKKPDIF